MNSIKNFRIAAMAILLVLVISYATSIAAEPDTVIKPNIVYVLVDDMGFGDLSCYGQSILKTPNIDKMAAEGMRFTQHYAGSTVCAPSRCALLTGKHSGHGSIRNNNPGLLRPGVDTTIAQRLKTAGYATAAVGKWGVGNPPPLDDPNRFGFDYFYGYISMWHAHNFYPEFMIENGEKVPLRNEVPEQWKSGDGRGVATTRLDYAPELITEKALRFISDHKDGPFFLYYAMNIPHANNEGGKNGMEVPDLYEFADTDWPSPEKGFAAMMRNIDNDVARLRDLLKELGIEKNTLVLFASDNGPHQEGGHIMTYFDSNGELRGMKRDMYDGGVRVPMIACWPGQVPADTTSDHVSAFWDIMPTLCELAGVDAPADTDGISILPTLLGQSNAQKDHEFLFWQFDAQGGKQAVRLGKWKGVRVDTFKNPDGPIELYDVTSDIEELNNVASANPEVVDRIRRIMARENVPLEQ